MRNYTIATAGIAYESFDDETVIVNMPVGHYYSLRNSAHDIFQLLPAGSNQQEIAKMLANKYGLDNETANDESESFLNKLAGINLLKETDKSKAYTKVITEQLPFTRPVLETFDDMEELLKLDPVHDVDTVQGWPLKK